MERDKQHLGEPDLRIGDLRLWVHGPDVVDTRPYEDWLRVTAHCGGAGASVWVSGEIVRYQDLREWVDQTEALYRNLAGFARLSPLEPNLSVALSVDRTGGVAASVEITPDHMNQQHRFSFVLDQSYLPDFLAQGRKLFRRIRVKAGP